MKTLAALASILTIVATPAAAQQLGARTASPEQVLAQMEESQVDPAADPLVLAAAQHPLGSARNPVRVGGPEGERSYLVRLRCADGAAPRIGNRNSAGTGAFGSIVDVYPLDCGAAAPGKTEIVMDKYHEEHRETNAPAGFTLAD